MWSYIHFIKRASSDCALLTVPCVYLTRRRQQVLWLRHVRVRLPVSQAMESWAAVDAIDEVTVVVTHPA
jgi:hypothetical protein